MAVKGGDLIHVANQVLLDRAQTAGPGQVNIPTERIYEVGNYQTVGTVLDIPDLSFPLESLDATAELEATLLGRVYASDSAGQAYDISRSLPMNVLSQFKRGKTHATPFEVEVGVVIPHLTLEQLTYRYGVSENAQQSCTLKGDSIFYTPGSVYTQDTVGSNTANQEIILTNDAYPYEGDVINGTRWALSVTLKSGRRLFYGTDYTEEGVVTAGVAVVTITILAAVPASDTIRISYSSDTVASYPQNSHTVDAATTPAAIRGRHIKVFVDGVDLTDAWTGVQSFNVDYKVTLDRDLEFGNSEVVSQDYDVPTVTGSIDLKTRTATELYNRVAQIAGVSALEVVGALQRVPLELDIVLYSPTDGTVLKTLYVEDARFTVPGYSGRVQQKLTTTFSFESDSGALIVYKGARP